MRQWCVAVFLCASLAACEKNSGEAELEKKAPPAVQEKAASSVSDESAPKKAPKSESTDQLPTDAQFAAVKKEVTVKGSTALGCETKLLDHFLRVHCTGDGLGPATALKMETALPPNAHVMTSDDALTLVHPFAPGTHIEALFSWTKASHPFVADWERGKPQPVIIGTFKGAASPLNRIAPTKEEMLKLLASLQSSPKGCMGQVPQWEQFSSYKELVKTGKKTMKVTAYAESIDPAQPEQFRACVSFNEGPLIATDSGYGSSSMVCFRLGENREVDESSLECHFAG